MALKLCWARLAIFASMTFSAVCSADSANALDEHSPAYKDAGERFVVPYPMPFSMPLNPSPNDVGLQIQRLCIQGKKLDAQVSNGQIHFDLAEGNAYFEVFPFQMIDTTCNDRKQQHLLGFTWPDGRIYPVSYKHDEPFDGWRRGDPLKMLKDERPLGYVDGQTEVQVLTTHRLLTIDGDKVSHSVSLSKRINIFVAARVSILRVDDDIYFGNDGGEWGGTLYRIDKRIGKVSLEDDGDPIVAIMHDPDHAGCTLVARAMSHMGMTSGGLVRVCHDSAKFILKEPVWSIAGRSSIKLAFSDGIGELKDDEVVNRRGFPSYDQIVAGVHYAKLGDVLLFSSGISQSVSVSGAVPILVESMEQASSR